MTRERSGEAIILETLERAGEACEDPAPLIYSRLFQAHPEFERLFALDTDGGVRGSMLQTAIDCLVDMAAQGPTAPAILASERLNHYSYGVPADRFESFFEAIRDTVRELNGKAWKPPEEAAWRSLLERVRAPADEG